MCKAFRALFAVLEIFLDKSDETQQHFYNDKSTKKSQQKIIHEGSLALRVHAVPWYGGSYMFTYAS